MNKRTLTAVVASLMFAVAAHAQIMHFLVAQWYENGNQMCKYDNGVVLNMGARLCPLSI